MRSAVGAVAAIAVLLGISAMAAGASGTDRAERPSTESSSLSSAEAVVLGIVEGVTEYLPVSSTGHLLITERLMGIGTSGDADKNAADSYTIAIQIGAIVAVLGIVVAGVAAFASVKFMISWLSQRGLALFGWYRIAAGIAAGVMILAGTI